MFFCPLYGRIHPQEKLSEQLAGRGCISVVSFVDSSPQGCNGTARLLPSVRMGELGCKDMRIRFS